MRAVFVWFQGGCFKTRVDFFFKYKFKPCGMWISIFYKRKIRSISFYCSNWATLTITAALC